MAPTASIHDLALAPTLETASPHRAAPARVVAASGVAERELRDRMAAWAADLARCAGGRVVKQSRQRTIVRVAAQAPFPALFVKQQRVLGFGARVKSMLRASRASVEFETAQRLRAMGIVAPRPLGYAEWRNGPALESTLSVMEEIADAPALDVYLSSVAATVRPRALAAAARALAAVHARHVDLTDCHKSNFLIIASAEGGADAVRLALLDLASVRMHAPSGAVRARRVGQLLHSLRAVLGADERRDFSRLYAVEAGMSPLQASRFASAVAREEDRIHRRRERSRDDRCLVDSTEFAATWSWTRRVFRRRDAAEAELLQAARLGADRRAVEASGATIVQEEGRNLCFITEIELPGGGRRRWFVKRIRSESYLSAFVDALRGSRGRRAWRASHGMTRRGVPTPRGHALIEEGFLMPVQSTLIFDCADGSASLRDCAAEFHRRYPSGRARREFLAELGRAVAALHRAAVQHDDLATKNILVATDGSPKFQFIDLEAVRALGEPLKREHYLRALMQLDDCPRAVTRTDRMRFLIAYEQALQTRFPRYDLVEVRRMLRERFARSKRDFSKEGPR